ncbi:hypothetical protein LIER_40611 [Lithospermum erythrorhizon]|uniref:Uncharacterized protein n=1 Tax=Lithospermum erythrorhizon TaxID=34254 RepID=A0AAV3QXB0_LITER
MIIIIVYTYYIYLRVICFNVRSTPRSPNLPSYSAQTKDEVEFYCNNSLDDPLFFDAAARNQSWTLDEDKTPFIEDQPLEEVLVDPLDDLPIDDVANGLDQTSNSQTQLVDPSSLANINSLAEDDEYWSSAESIELDPSSLTDQISSMDIEFENNANSLLSSLMFPSSFGVDVTSFLNWDWKISTIWDVIIPGLVSGKENPSMKNLTEQ